MLFVVMKIELQKFCYKKLKGQKFFCLNTIVTITNEPFQIKLNIEQISIVTSQWLLCFKKEILQ